MKVPPGLFEGIGRDIMQSNSDEYRFSRSPEKHTEVLAEDKSLGGVLASWAEGPQKASLPKRITAVDRIDAFRRAGTLVQFYRKSALEGVLFDPALGPGESLRYGSGEDTDFLLQVLGKGLRIARLHELLVYHAEPDLQDPALFLKVRSYAAGRMQLLRKHTFSLWFQLMNVLYPLALLPREGPKYWPYRKAMFLERLRSFLYKD